MTDYFDKEEFGKELNLEFSRMRAEREARMTELKDEIAEKKNSIAKDIAEHKFALAMGNTKEAIETKYHKAEEGLKEYEQLKNKNGSEMQKLQDEIEQLEYFQSIYK